MRNGQPNSPPNKPEALPHEPAAHLKRLSQEPCRPQERRLRCADEEQGARRDWSIKTESCPGAPQGGGVEKGVAMTGTRDVRVLVPCAWPCWNARQPGGNGGRSGSPEIPEGEAQITRFYFINCSHWQRESLPASSAGQNPGANWKFLDAADKTASMLFWQTAKHSDCAPVPP